MIEFFSFSICDNNFQFYKTTLGILAFHLSEKVMGLMQFLQYCVEVSCVEEEAELQYETLCLAVSLHSLTYGHEL